MSSIFGKVIQFLLLVICHFSIQMYQFPILTILWLNVLSTNSCLMKL
uniref:Uncharacterized protein n=1 Tax=Strongyloides venezuelensis TaxID=75913 RepID=A0A0K0ETT6_STRVS